MNESCVRERLKRAVPLINLVNMFPGAHSLHSVQADNVSRGRWNVHALRDLIDSVDGKNICGDLNVIYGWATLACKRAEGAQEQGIILNRQGDVSLYNSFATRETDVPEYAI